MTSTVTPHPPARVPVAVEPAPSRADRPDGPDHRVPADPAARHEHGFSMALSRSGAPADPDCVQRSAGGDLTVLLPLVPWSRDDLSLDLARRHPDVDDAVVELSDVELLTAARARGTRRVSLNFAGFRSASARGERIGAGPFLRLWVRVLLLTSRWWQISARYRSQSPALLSQGRTESIR